MKTVFDKAARNELVARINTLSEKSVAGWGKMNVSQMLRHCTIWEEWIQGVHHPKYRQEWLGFIFGKLALRTMLKEGKPFDKNVPTSKAFQVKEMNDDLELEKKKWIGLIESYENYHNPGFIHDFFGRMTREQIGALAYKHTDHHLRQFGS
jgi:hypothetical protein